MVVQVAGVVAEFVDMRSHDLRHPIVLLQIHRQVGFGLVANFGQSGSFFFVVDGDANDIGTGIVHQVHERDGGVDVSGFGGGHRLDRDRVSSHRLSSSQF